MAVAIILLSRKWQFQGSRYSGYLINLELSVGRHVAVLYYLVLCYLMQNEVLYDLILWPVNQNNTIGAINPTRKRNYYTLQSRIKELTSTRQSDKSYHTSSCDNHNAK